MSVPLPKHFGWVGLGAMGYPMAMQLRKKLPKESSLFIYDLAEDALNRFVKDTTDFGPVFIQSSSKDVAGNSECFISIVPEGSHVKSVYLTPETGALAAGNLAGKVFIDCSTIDPSTSLEVGDAVEKLNPSNPPRFFDAPVSGGTAGAEKATLTFMVGAAADEPLYPLLHQIFSFMGTSIHPVGGRSLGLAAKLSNNYLSGIIALATSEAMNLGMRLGIDPKVLSDCFKTSSGSNWVNNTVNPVPGVSPDAVTSRGYEGGFKVQLMKKDMSLAVQAAQLVSAKLILADAGLSAYTAAADDPNCRDKDSRVIYRWLGGVEPDIESKVPQQ